MHVCLSIGISWYFSIFFSLSPTPGRYSRGLWPASIYTYLPCTASENFCANINEVYTVLRSRMVNTHLHAHRYICICLYFVYIYIYIYYVHTHAHTSNKTCVCISRCLQVFNHPRWCQKQHVTTRSSVESAHVIHLLGGSSWVMPIPSKPSSVSYSGKSWFHDD